MRYICIKFDRPTKVRLRTLMAITLAINLSGCKPASETGEPPAPKVSGDEIVFATNAPELSSFTVEPARLSRAEATSIFGRLIWNGDATANIFSPVGGRVLRIPVELNQPITTRDVLAEVDSPDYSQALADARTAEGNFAAADKAFSRAKELLAHGAAAQKDVESAEAAYRAANAESERAKARLANYGGNLGGTNAAYLLRSPLPGVLVEKNLLPGQEIRADMMLANAPQFFAPLFVVTDPSRLWLQLDVTESDLRHLKQGAPVKIRSESFPEETFTGKIDLVSESLDPNTRKVTVRGSVDNSSGKLKAEMLVTAELAADETPRLQVPAKAVFLRGNEHCIFVEEQPGAFRRREVKVGNTADDTMEIVAGLQPGERVVSDGALLLEELFE